MMMTMRKLVFLLCMMLVVATGGAQEVIEMEPTGSGTYKITCAINGAPMRMYFDTGASGVSLSSSAAGYLLQNGFLKQKDLVGMGMSSIADGSTVKTFIAILRDVSIGSVHIKNVQALIDQNQSAPMLFGMSAIQSLGTVTIDGNRLIIHQTHYTEKDVPKLEREVDTYITNGNFSAAYNDLMKINQAVGLSPKNALKHAICCYNLELFEECLGSCAQWLQSYGNRNNDGEAEVYGLVADSYFNLAKYQDAVPWFQRWLSLGKGDANMVSLRTFCLGQCYFSLNDMRNALPCFKSAASMRRRILGVTINDIQYGRVHDDALGLMFKLYAISYLKAGQQRPCLQLLVISARCGDEESRQFCKDNHIRY